MGHWDCNEGLSGALGLQWESVGIYAGTRWGSLLGSGDNSAAHPRTGLTWLGAVGLRWGRGGRRMRIHRAEGRREEGAAHPQVLTDTELLVGTKAVLEGRAKEPRAGHASRGQRDLVPAQQPQPLSPPRRSSPQHGGVPQRAELREKGGLCL